MPRQGKFEGPAQITQLGRGRPGHELAPAASEDPAQIHLQDGFLGLVNTPQSL